MVADENTNSIVSDLEIFNENYIPENILTRSSQVREIQLCLSLAYRNGRPINAWLYGPPGTGKTMVARFILNKLKEESRIGSIYVNCWKSNSVYAVLDTILNELRIGFGDERDSRLKLYKFETFVDNKPFVIVLDEIDLVDPRERNMMIYYLLAVRKVGLICISESREPIFTLEDRVKSRLNPEFVYFGPYTKDELVDILKERALSALRSKTWNEDIIQRIAGLAEGDARTAIQTIKNTTLRAENDGSGAIMPDHVNKPGGEMRSLKKEYLLKKLSEDQRLLYGIIQKRGPVISGKLWKSYLKECAIRKVKPVARRTFSHYMEKLSQLNLIKVERARVKGRIYVYSIND